MPGVQRHASFGSGRSWVIATWPLALIASPVVMPASPQLMSMISSPSVRNASYSYSPLTSPTSLMSWPNAGRAPGVTDSMPSASVHRNAS